MKISITPRVGEFAGRVVETDRHGQGVFTRETSGLQQHLGTGQTPTFKTALSFAKFVAKNFPAYGKNPALLTLKNPPRVGSKRVEKLSDRVCHIEYVHAAGGKTDRPYRHVFNAGVCMELLTDGSVRIYSASGKPLYKWFD